MLEDSPQALEDVLHLDLDSSAKQTQAFVRKRGIQRAGDLLRLVLMYVASDWSFKLVAWWALVQGIGQGPFSSSSNMGVSESAVAFS
jgi:hypothetical protein